ncbi:TPM domain-containing protein [Defluviimonas sp. WL0024]|uniref:TPM domain-containing protein n=1 Tax=Albidovulum salinarum TaxID=2984153 RepID=A0ABT2WZ16_9RHOB|nr:TPM domain-containing protein [Defluviimonas sp. WL0024]MCU9846928.1 TPM domain-containing protein [Defluviimonas sp. WL0024]
MPPFRAALTGLLWLCLGLPSAAEPYPAFDDPFVTDHAGIIDASTIADLQRDLGTLRTETGVEMTVLTIRSRADYDPAPSLEAFATGLFNAWGVGAAERNDGILFLVVTADREMRIELGAGYHQGYDVTAQDIVSRWMVPAFRDGRYAEGVAAGVRETMNRIARRHAERMLPEALPDTGRGMFGRNAGWLAVAFVAAVAAVIGFRHRIAGAYAGLRRCPRCGARGLRRHRSVLAEPTTDRPGAGRLITRCRSCDFREERAYRIAPRRKRRAKGGGDGFGGGRSSGGGASGRW